MTPYEKLKQKRAANILSWVGGCVIKDLDENNLNTLFHLNKVKKEHLLEFLEMSNRNDLIDKLDDVVNTAKNLFNNMIELLTINSYHEFFTQYLLMNANTRQLFKIYIERDCDIYWKCQEKKSETANNLLFKISMIDKVVLVDAKNVIHFKSDKDHVYLIESDVYFSVSLHRQTLRRKVPDGLLKELKDGQIIFINKTLYKVVVISTSLYSEPNNVRLLKI